MKSISQPIIVEQIFDQNIETVWKAITQLHQMKQWFFENIPDFEAIVGFEIQFNVKAPSRDFLHCWKITQVIANKKIVYQWKYENISGEGTVSFELFEENNQTKLVLTNEGLETFPQDIPEFSREGCIDGWNYFIKKRLKEYLNN
ncbi:MAG: SRPBCC domain-containing protein [Flavobacteriaceae bacterium]|nr:SRPBCC domain-containing protein [Flavobacteriaceae bacterium]